MATRGSNLQYQDDSYDAAGEGSGEGQGGQPEQIKKQSKLHLVTDSEAGGTSEQDVEIQLNSQRKEDREAGEGGASGAGGKVVPFRKKPGYVPFTGTGRFSGGGESEGGGDVMESGAVDADEATAPKDFAMEESILDEDAGGDMDSPALSTEQPTLDAAGQDQAAAGLEEQRRFLQMQQREDEQGGEVGEGGGDGQGGTSGAGGESPTAPGGEEQGAQPTPEAEAGGQQGNQQPAGAEEQSTANGQAPGTPAGTLPGTPAGAAGQQQATLQTPQQQSQAGTQLQTDRKEAGAGAAETEKEGEKDKDTDKESDPTKKAAGELKEKLNPVRLITDWILRWAVRYCATLEPFGILLLVAPYMNWHFILRYWKDKKTHYRDMKIYEMLILGLIDIVWIGIVICLVILIYMGQAMVEGAGDIVEFFAGISPVIRIFDTLFSVLTKVL